MSGETTLSLVARVREAAEVNGWRLEWSDSSDRGGLRASLGPVSGEGVSATEALHRLGEALMERERESGAV